MSAGARQFQGFDRALQRAWIKGAGYTDRDLDRPLIGIANTYQSFAPENVHLRDIAEHVRAGIYMAGGTPLEFNAFHVTDCIAFAAESMRYVLPSRDIIADLVELMVKGHGMDGIVLLPSGDKVVPGMAMAAARLDIPAIMLYGGPTRYGEYKGRKIFLETVYDAVGEFVMGKISEKDFREIEDRLMPGAGACDTLTSGNTAGLYTEALGLALPRSGTIPAGSPLQKRVAQAVGSRAVELVRENIRPSSILTRNAFENALRVVLSVGGSTNLVLHLIAMAREAGITLTFDDIDAIGRSTPTVAKIAPSGPWGVTDLDAAGGVPAVMRRLQMVLHGETRNVSGQTTAEIIASAPEEPNEVLPEKPHDAEGAIFILKGTLAPEGCVVKVSGVKPDMWSFSGAARVFDDEEAAIAFILSGAIAQPTVIVIRYEGPRGGPGMREMLGATSALVGLGADDRCMLVTDGRFSGATHGPAIGYVTPEAASGGPIAIVQDGDRITVDLRARRLDLDVTGSEVELRRARLTPRAPNVTRGYLKFYSDHVAPATEGAVLPR